MSRIATTAALPGCWMLPVVGAAQVGVPNARGVHKPTGTTCAAVARTPQLLELDESEPLQP